MKFEFEADNCFYVDNEFYITPSLSVTLIPEVDSVETVVVDFRFLAWRVAAALTKT